MKYEYIICVWTVYGWCLETIAGYNLAHAIKVRKEKEQKHPNKEFIVYRTNPRENWWNKTRGTV